MSYALCPNRAEPMKFKNHPGCSGYRFPGDLGVCRFASQLPRRCRRRRRHTTTTTPHPSPASTPAPNSHPTARRGPLVDGVAGVGAHVPREPATSLHQQHSKHAPLRAKTAGQQRFRRVKRVSQRRGESFGGTRDGITRKLRCVTVLLLLQLTNSTFRASSTCRHQTMNTSSQTTTKTPALRRLPPSLPLSLFPFLSVAFNRTQSNSFIMCCCTEASPVLPFLSQHRNMLLNVQHGACCGTVKSSMPLRLLARRLMSFLCDNRCYVSL